MNANDDKWFVQKKGKTIGPFTVNKLVEFYSSGKIDIKTLVKTTNDEEWTELQLIVEFDLLFNAVDSSPVGGGEVEAVMVVAVVEPKKKKKSSKTNSKNTRSINAGHIVVFVSAGLFLLSLVLPWYDVILFSIPGYRTSAILFFIFFIPSLITSFCKLPIPLVLGSLQGLTIVVALIVVMINFTIISHPMSDEDILFNATGFGLYVAIFSGLGLILGACLHLYVSVPDSLDELIKG